jgi:hypothetical protein
MANVFVLNMCYDIPVKIYSFSLLLVAMVIASPDLVRLARLFVWNRAVEPADLAGPWTNRRARTAALAIKFAWVGVMVPFSFWENHQARFVYGDLAPKGALDGLWKVASFRRDGVEVPPLAGDSTCWRHLQCTDEPGWKSLVLRRMGGVDDRWRLEFLDADGAVSESGERGRLVLREMIAAAGADPSASKVVATLDYAREGEGRLRISGEFGGARIEVECARAEARDFLLLERGFHWINERPFNR